MNFLARRGDCLKKNSWVIPGSPTELIEIDQDTELKVAIERVGEVITLFQETVANKAVSSMEPSAASDL